MSEGYRLKQVLPKEVRFNKQNPRGESEGDIKEDSSFEQLKDSVSQFGVLVPIVVHEKSGHDGKKYTLVDGERRLRAALITNTKKIPAHIATAENTTDEMIQAFHIHMLRKQWKPVAIAIAFKEIKKELKKNSKINTDKDLLRDLQSRTGCSDKQIEELERAIRYPKNVLTEVSKGQILWSHLIQNEASFIEQLGRHYPNLLKSLGEDYIRRELINKEKQKIIGTTRELIKNILPIVQRAETDEEKEVAGNLFKEFIKTPNISPEEIKLRFDKIFPPPKSQVELASEIIHKCELLNPMVTQIQEKQIISFHEQAKELKKSMECLQKVLNMKIRKINKVMNCEV